MTPPRKTGTKKADAKKTTRRVSATSADAKKTAGKKTATRKAPATTPAKKTATRKTAAKAPAKKKTTAKKTATKRIRAPRKNQRVTIKSVAEAAGVSIATVSFVLNNRPGQVISEPVKKRVLQAAKALNYAPSAAAAGLARKSTTNVAIVFYKNDHLIANQLYSFVVQGAIKEASAREYNILFSFMPDDFCDYHDLPKVVREKNTEGVLFIQDVSSDLVDELRDRNLSVVAVDSHPFVPGLSTLYVDNVRGARLAARHLIDLGHKELAFLRSGSDRPSIEERSQGFIAELKAEGLSTKRQDIFIEAEELTFQAGYERAKTVLKKRPELTALFCANDELAAGAMRAAHELGLSVPDDLSIIGFDDIIMSRYLAPPLTTVSCDKEAMGRRAMARLLDLIRGDDSSATRELLEVELVERASTGPVRKS